MDRVRTIIVDDEPLARARLLDLLETNPDVEIVAECADGEEAVEAIGVHRPDLVFLDVQMPGMDGFDVIRGVGAERMPIVVFVTAYDRYALKAFEVHALDYLLKPFDAERFRSALARAVDQIRSARGAEVRDQMLSLIQELQARTSYLERVMIKSGGRLFFLKTAEISWLEAEGNYVRVHAGASSHLIRETIAHLETQLDPNRFMRIHRSTIVNLDRIREIHQAFGGDYTVVLEDGTKLKLSRTYRDRLAR